MLCENKVKLLIVKVLNFLFELYYSVREFEMHDTYLQLESTINVYVWQNVSFMFVLTTLHACFTFNTNVNTIVFDFFLGADCCRRCLLFAPSMVK